MRVSKPWPFLREIRLKIDTLFKVPEQNQSGYELLNSESKLWKGENVEATELSLYLSTGHTNSNYWYDQWIVTVKVSFRVASNTTIERLDRFTIEKHEYCWTVWTLAVTLLKISSMNSFF